MTATPSCSLTPKGVLALAEAIFREPGAALYEAYSAIDTDPIQLHSQCEFIDYVDAHDFSEDGPVHCVLHYPDMLGEIRKRRIDLDSPRFPGGRFRYTWDGLGLISIQLPGSPGLPRITANSEARARAWANTQPQLLGPTAWAWRAVASHKRRLLRIVRKFSTDGEQVSRG